MQYVYHGSSKRGLKVLKPSVSTHGESWVYATKDLVMSAVFLGREGGDLTCQVGRNEDGTVYVTERFEGAFDMRYKTSGSLYRLSRKGFLENKTSWREEVVSPSAVKVVEEIDIPNVRDYLKGLEKEGKLIVSYFPERYNVSLDDQDLVKKCADWTVEHGEGYLNVVKKYHPNLIARIKKEIEKNDDKTSPKKGN